MAKAIDEKQYGTIKDILDGGFKDVTKFFYNNIIGYNPDIKVLQLLIDYGADVNVMCSGRPIIQQIFTRAYNSQMKLKVIRLLVKNGADLFLKSIDGKREEERGDFFDFLMVNTRIKTDLVLNIIKEESPEQYEKYLMKKNAIKYNL